MGRKTEKEKEEVEEKVESAVMRPVSLERLS